MLRAAMAEFRPDRAQLLVSAAAITRSVTWVCALTIAVMAAVTDRVSAQTRATTAPIEFDIPSQPLNTALSRYGDATGREALYDGSLAVGKVSGDVRGTFSPDDALKTLLAGTGLAAEFVEATTFVLLPASMIHQQVRQQVRSPEHRRYYGLIQASLLETFCRSRSVRPGRYRFAAVFWIASNGAVQRSQRIGSTGDPDADQRIDAALHSVRIGEPPPVGFVQPVLMLIVPQVSMVTGCDAQPPSFRSVGGAR